MSPTPTPAPRGARIAALCLAFSLAGCDIAHLSYWFDAPAEGGSILTLLGTEGRELAIGDEVRGALSSSDYRSLSGSYLEAWELDAKEGESLTIDLVSSDFDAYLYVVGPGLAETLQDDDSGGACHARVQLDVLDSGTFRVVASATGNQTGTYNLRVSADPGPRAAMSCGGVDGMALAALPTQGRVLRPGEVAQGLLTGAEQSIENQRPVQAWSLHGVAGESVTVRLQSEDFDAYLYLFGPGMTEAMTDDDSAGDLDSELTITFRETGTYTVGAAALTSGSTGAYMLTLDEPVDLAALPTGPRELWVTSEAFGTLTEADPRFEGKPVQAWAFRAEAGQIVTVDLTSEDFDSYLRVVGPGLAGPLTDDDGGDGLDSRLQIAFPQDGVYRIIASSLGGDTGSYTLRLR